MPRGLGGGPCSATAPRWLLRCNRLRSPENLGSSKNKLGGSGQKGGFVKRFWSSVQSWLPFLASAYLCYSVLAFRDAALPAFYSFLPMAFLFVAVAFGRVNHELRQVREKLKALEATSKAIA